MTAMTVPIAKFGEIQKIDIQQSTGVVLYDEIARVCSVFKPHGKFHGDLAPFRMAELFGGSWEQYNDQLVVQVADCPMHCPYCYVDNLEKDVELSAEDLVYEFAQMDNRYADMTGRRLRVFHIMGGCPAKYPEMWMQLREKLDYWYHSNVVIYSDTILVENHVYNVNPWTFLGKIKRFMLVGCLKGTTKKNFEENSGLDLYEEALEELGRYAGYDNFYLTLLNADMNHLFGVFKKIKPTKIDFLTQVDYEVTKQRRTINELVSSAFSAREGRRDED